MALCSLLAAASFAAPASAAAAKTVQIVIENFSFNPPSVTVDKGTTVVWVNHDPTPHSVVGEQPAFNSGLLGVDDTFSYTFKEAGNVTFICDQHAHMSGTVTVTGK